MDPSIVELFDIMDAARLESNGEDDDDNNSALYSSSSNRPVERRKERPASAQTFALSAAAVPECRHSATFLDKLYTPKATEATTALMDSWSLPF